MAQHHKQIRIIARIVTTRVLLAQCQNSDQPVFTFYWAKQFYLRGIKDIPFLLPQALELRIYIYSLFGEWAIFSLEPGYYWAFFTKLDGGDWLGGVSSPASGSG